MAKKPNAVPAVQHVANPSAPPSSLTNINVSPTGGAGGPCQTGSTVITSLKFTVTGTVTPPPNPSLWPVQGYVYANGDRYLAPAGAQVDPTSGNWSLSFDLTTWVPAITSGTTGQLKVYYSDPNDPASYILSPICFNLTGVTPLSAKRGTAHASR